MPPAPASESNPDQGVEPRRVITLFCIALSEALKSIDETSIDGHSPVELFVHGPLAAVASWIDEDVLCGEETAARLQDIEWVAPLALRHAQIIQKAMQSSAVFPMRFGTLFSSAGKLEEFLNQNQAAILSFLEEMADADEWGVKVYLDRGAMLDSMVAEASREKGDSVPKSPGARYLNEQRIRLALEKEVDAWGRAASDTIAKSLDRHATHSCRRRVAAGAVDEDGRALVANLAFVVARNGADSFHKKAAHLKAKHAGAGISFTLTGPWPPHSFAPAIGDDSDEQEE